ncbi:MAG: YggS family pyridoxal phosphate-dependent enzyme [Rhodobacterales bacterium CG15_BIG_FIL_POST_REV_8_21_14_020_59_13]|nr:MAG: YggS family pyridoxal phosphate-dependent enzyme [Rhodobacterales bacterium CG15_BIG_FIL_POST_REV_8_21_14_020_59_13]
MTLSVNEFAARRNDVLKRIAAAAKAAGRDASAVTLTGVSKKQPDDRIAEALATGQRVFGENRVQEAETRWAGRREDVPDLELRLIGPLQTNKSEQAVALFDVIETLDRVKLAKALKKAMEKLNKHPRLYVQVNTGEEDQKAGIAPHELPAFLKQMRDEFGFSIEGLMCIPPVEDPAGPHFALLADLAAATGIEKLSMGMSGDYETAVKFGATSVRVGSALFGERPTA